MGVVAVAILVAGVGFVALVSAGGGGAALGGFELGLLISIFTAAVFVVAVVIRQKRVAPAICDSCRGLNSSNAPFCKHCGATL